MANLEVLRLELDTGHPDTGSYNADNQLAADEINVVNRTRNRDIISGDNIFAATVSAGFLALSDLNKQLWVSFCGRNELDPFGTANVDFVKFIFGFPSATVTALNSVRVENISRATELGLSRVREGTVAAARAL